MEKKDKTGLLILGGLVLMGLAKKPLAPPPGPPPPPEEPIHPLVYIEDIQPMSPGVMGGEVWPDQLVTLRATVLNKSTKAGVPVALPVSIEYAIYEGSVMPIRGTQLATLITSTTLPADIASSHDSSKYTAALGSIDRRDVRVRVIYEGVNILASKEWDDVFYVRVAPVVTSADILDIGWFV